MRKIDVFVLVLVVGCLMLMGIQCVPPQPNGNQTPVDPEQVLFAFIQVYQDFNAGEDNGPLTDEQIAALTKLWQDYGAGKPLKGVARTEENKIISPVTGKPCSFLTKEGPTYLGALLINLILNR